MVRNDGTGARQSGDRRVKYLIVNGDDLGASRGVNRGIFEAHRCGILTSASLLVDLPGSDEAAAVARETPLLSVGLHADLRGCASDTVQVELERQLEHFEALMGALPTHLDSHRNAHRDPGVLPSVLTVARQYGLLVRDFSPVLYVSEFYGQGGGKTRLEQVSVAALERILRTRIREGLTELGVHPGYVDPDLQSRYAVERESELRTLCDPSIRETLREAGIHLASFRDAPRLLRQSAIPE